MSAITPWNKILKILFTHWNPPNCSFVALWKLCGSTLYASLKPDLYLQQKNKDKCLFHCVTVTSYPPTQPYTCECTHTHTRATHWEARPALPSRARYLLQTSCLCRHFVCFWLTVMGLCWQATAAVRRWARGREKAWHEIIRRNKNIMRGEERSPMTGVQLGVFWKEKKKKMEVETKKREAWVAKSAVRRQVGLCGSSSVSYREPLV